MTTSTRATYPKFKASYATTNLPLSGGLLYTYTRGTTTAKTTYSDIGKTTANANPVVLDSAGEATIFLDGSYKFVLKDSDGNTLWTQDDVNVTESTTALASDSAFGLVTNGSFEDDTDGDGDPDGWTVTRTGTVALDATDANHASQCLKFTSTGSGGGYITSTDFMEVSANNSYSIIFSVKSSVADVRNLVTVSWYDLDQVIIAGSPVTVWDDSATNPTSWTEKRFSVTPATGACFAKLTFHGCHSSDATSGNTKYDYIRMFDERMGDLSVYNVDMLGTLTVESQDAGATVGPSVILYRNSASPAASDVIGEVQFSGEDSAGNTQLYAQIHGVISDPTSTSEDGQLVIQTTVAGTAADRVTVGQGMQIGSPTGTDKGAGTLNLDNDLYKDGVNITSPEAVDTNFIGGHAVYYHNDSNSGSTAYDIDANVTAASWETFGKTSSGLNNEWSQLDNVPSTAKAIIVRFYASVQGSTSGTTYNQSAYCRKYGGSATPGGDNALFYTGTTNRSGSAESAFAGQLAVIPVDSSARFELYYAKTVGSTCVCSLYLVGWIDSLI